MLKGSGADWFLVRSFALVNHSLTLVLEESWIIILSSAVTTALAQLLEACYESSVSVHGYGASG